MTGVDAIDFYYEQVVFSATSGYLWVSPLSRILVMNKFVLAALLLLSLSAAWGQKIEVKKDLILVDGQPYARIEADGCGVLDVQCMYYVKALVGEQRLFVVKQLEYADPAGRETS